MIYHPTEAERAAFASHELEQRRQEAKWTLRQKLLWLEKAQDLAGQLARGREKRSAEEQTDAAS